MRRRRTLIALAAGLFVSAIAASVLSSPGPPGRGDAGPGPSPPAAAPARPPADPAIRVRFDARAPAPVSRSVPVRARAVVTVAAHRPGEVRLEGLGLVASADALTPAVFDVVPGRPGRFAVVFAPAGEPARRAGTLIVER